jgi:LmbE family N-acetylglucosaminyl deacetylase
MQTTHPLLLLLFFLSIISTACENRNEKKPTVKKPILVVLAHPDDETAFGPVLAKYARLGHPVQLIIAVTAENDTRHLQASPDSVRKAKQAQTICSAEKLGILPPLFGGHESLDRKFGERDGVRASVEAGVALRDMIRKTIDQLQPGAILSFGPDGEYGHPEHIIVSSIVTELLLRERWVDKYPLYYFGWTRSQEASGDGWVHYVDDAYLPIRITYTEEDESRAFESLRCYTAGFSPEEMKEMITAETGRANELFFRRLVVDTTKVEGLFP